MLSINMTAVFHFLVFLIKLSLVLQFSGLVEENLLIPSSDSRITPCTDCPTPQITHIPVLLGMAAVWSCSNILVDSGGF
jgi:hypothetical protein